jgi:membrane protein involved in colicin uptake
MDTLIQSPALGHNGPPIVDPDVLADLAGRTDQFMAASTEIRAKYAPLQSEEHAKLLTDHIKGLRGLKSQVDEARKAAKKPFDEGAKAVQEVFTPILERIDRAVTAMLGIQTEYGNRKAKLEAERKAEAERVAREAREAAERAAKEAAASGDLDAEAAAARAQKEADALAKEAARDVKVNIGSATGAGRTIAMVTVREAEIENINLLFVHYRARPEVAEVLLRLANADVRGKVLTETNAATYGVKINTRQVAR